MWLLYLGFVVYGSLVPLNYQPRPLDEAWLLFQNIRLLDVGAQGRADWIANGVLYLPLAFLTAQVFGSRHTPPPPLALGAAYLFCLAVAVGVEFLQLHFPPRTVSLNDLVAEAIGGLLGVSLAAVWGERFRRLLTAMAGDLAQLPIHLLKAYALAYLAFSLFPYDFMASSAELADKMRSGAWGSFLAPVVWQGPAASTLAKLAGEGLGVLPLGYLAAYPRRGRRRHTVLGVLGMGAALGLVIELVQFFIVSGVSQGVSVLTRATGFAAGAWLAQGGGGLNPMQLAVLVRRWLLPLGMLYMLLLGAVNGWFERRWLDWTQAQQTLDGLRFLPFYYHYYTTEQAALLSLMAVALMYAPIGLATWATWTAPVLALVLGALVASLVETSKLFLEGLRPDPTNVLLGGLAAWAAAHLARRLARAVQAERAADRVSHNEAEDPPTFSKPNPQIQPSERPAPTGLSLRRPTWLGYALMASGLGAAAWGVLDFPVLSVLLGLLLAIYAAALWYRPQAMLIVVPAALPLLDLAPWSGRFFFDEFDLLLLVTVAVGYARLPPPSRRLPRDPWLQMAVGLLVLTYAIATWRGLTPWQPPDLNAFSHYYSPYNALRIAKGVLWALLLFGLYRRLQGRLEGLADRFALGMTLGLAGTVLVVLWERLAFPGLLDFDDAYRVTGPFAQMHVGTADLEAYLTMAVPFLLYLTFTRSGWQAKATGALLLLGATYAVMVSFARIGFVAYAVAVVLSLLALIIARTRRGGRGTLEGGVWAISILALAAVVALPIVLGPFAQQRLARAEADLDRRIAHWEKVLAMRDPGWTTTLFGMGLGSYPRTHYLRAPEERAASYQLLHEGGESYLSLTPGSPVYIEQFVQVQPDTQYRLDLRLRGQQLAVLTVALCEKWLLTSARCVFKRVGATADGQWTEVKDVRLNSGELGATPWYAHRPVKLSLYNVGPGVVDVDRINLRSQQGESLIENSGFGQGLDHWFFSADAGQPWDISSLPISVLFELGWLGVIAWAGFLGLAMVHGAHALWQGLTKTAAPWAAVIGFMVLGTLHGLIQSPRILLLGVLLATIAAMRVGPAEHRTT